MLDKITYIALVHLDGAVYARCYNGKKFVDAKLAPNVLANLVSDGAKLVGSLLAAKPRRKIPARE